MDAERAQAYPFISRPGATPLVIERTEGAYLITPDGRRILDAAGGAIVVNIGHGRREVAEAFTRGAAEATYVVPPFATESRVRLVERLRNHWLPTELTRVAFTSGGSESMDAAIRLARQHHVSAGRPQRWKVIDCDPARDVITIGPPFIISDDEVDQLASSLERAITNAVSWLATRA